MAFAWPGMAYHRGTIDPAKAEEIRAVTKEFFDKLAELFDSASISRTISPIGRPWSSLSVWSPEMIWIGFTPATGMSSTASASTDEACSAEDVRQIAKTELGWTLESIVRLPREGSSERDAEIESAIEDHVREISETMTFDRLGDVEHVRHLRPYLEQFLADHPDPDCNVLVMMPFAETPQLTTIHSTIQSALEQRGLKALRVDDRDFTGDLWSNIEVYLTGCRFGIAVFEDIDRRDFNPNVSLELGYMMGRGKRCLLLKEQRLAQMPSDVAHKLYRTFDSYNIEATVSAEVGRWLDVDLRIGDIAAQ